MAHVYQDYQVGQTVTARVIDVRERELALLVDGDVPGLLPVASPVNFDADPVRHFLPGDETRLVVAKLDHVHQAVILKLGKDYAARLRSADMDQIARETRNAIVWMSQQRALAVAHDDEDEDLFFDFESRREVHGSHSAPHMLEDDFDNFADTLYQQIDEKLGDDLETDDEE